MKRSKIKFKNTKEMLSFLNEIEKRNEIAIKQHEVEIKKYEVLLKKAEAAEPALRYKRNKEI